MPLHKGTQYNYIKQINDLNIKTTNIDNMSKYPINNNIHNSSKIFNIIRNYKCKNLRSNIIIRKAIKKKNININIHYKNTRNKFLINQSSKKDMNSKSLCYNCKKCNKVFNKLKAYKLHLITHQTFSCPYPDCHYKFNSSSIYHKHMIHHIKENNTNKLNTLYSTVLNNNIVYYSCNQCLLTFKNYSRLIHHLKTHSKERQVK